MTSTAPTFDRGRPSRWRRLMFKAPVVLYRDGPAEIMRRRCVMLLTTKGRQSGLPRTGGISFMPLDDRFVVFSGWGIRSDWYQNLLADPEYPPDRAAPHPSDRGASRRSGAAAPAHGADARAVCPMWPAAPHPRAAATNRGPRLRWRVRARRRASRIAAGGRTDSSSRSTGQAPTPLSFQ